MPRCSQPQTSLWKQTSIIRLFYGSLAGAVAVSGAGRLRDFDLDQLPASIAEFGVARSETDRYVVRIGDELTA